MKKRTLIMFSLILFSLGIQAQDQINLKTLSDQLMQEIKEVSTSKETYEQKVVFDAQKPWKAILTITEIDKKGRESVMEYRFNLSDLDKNTIDIESNKDEQIVEMQTRGRSKFIKAYKDGELDDYTDKLELWAVDIDNARAIKEALRKVIEPAKDAWEEYIAVDENGIDLKEWLKGKIGTVSQKKEEIIQAVVFDLTLKDQMELTQEDSGKGEQIKFSFSLADLDPKKLSLEVKGESLFIECETKRKQDYLEVREEGDIVDMDNNFRIYVSEIDEGRQIVNVLDSLIAFGEKQLEERMPTPATLEEALPLLAANVKNYASAEISIDQTIEPKAVTKYSATISEDGEGEEQEYIFALGDINSRDIEIDVSKTAIHVELNSKNKNKYIQYFENGKADDFISKMSIRAISVENAKVLKLLLAFIAEKAADLPIEEKDWDWFKNHIQAASTGEITQQLKKQDGEASNCKMVFTKNNLEKAEEEIFEFNVYDINAKKVEVDISGAEVGLSLETVGGEDIIKYYEDGEPSFTNSMFLRLTNLEDVKIAKATFLKIAEGCKE